MKILPKSEIMNLHRPSDVIFFKDDSEHWLAFRKVRYATAGDGEYALLYALNLSGYSLVKLRFPATPCLRQPSA